MRRGWHAVEASLGELARRLPPLWRPWAVALGMFAVFSIVLVSRVVPPTVNLAVEQVAPADITAGKSIINRVRTEEAKRRAAAAVPDVYELDHAVVSAVEAQIISVIAQVMAAREAPGTVEARSEALRAQAGVDLLQGSWRYALTASAADVREAEAAAKGIIRHVMAGGLRAEVLEAAKSQATAEAAALRLPASARNFVADLAKAALRPNMLFNEAETKQRRQEAMDGVTPVRIPKGFVVLRRGEIVTEEHIIILQDLGLQRDGLDAGGIAGALLAAALLVAVPVAYVYQFGRNLFSEFRLLFLGGLVTSVTLVLSVLLMPLSGFLAPVAMGSMLLATLLDRGLAVIQALTLAMAIGLVGGMELGFALVALAGGLVGVFSVRRITRRFDLMRAGALVGLANAVMILTLALIGAESVFGLDVVKHMGVGGVNGALSAVLAIGSLPFFEGAFGVVTPTRLLELSNPNEPLLKRLLVEAPGTYHHSIIVGNLAEAAADAIGANSLLARVGAYYHDVGKVIRPYFFIDNQHGADNPHDRISPHLSTRIIVSHVRDGVALAKEHGLPQPLVDIIGQHHGTTVVSYFYARAVEDGKSKLAETDFRYEGPRPELREAAVVMLADSVEAASRALTRPTPGRLSSLVAKIVRDRLQDGQLDRSDLTLRDLDAITGAFVRVLGGIFHPRIEYPNGGGRPEAAAPEPEPVPDAAAQGGKTDAR
ncbi:MAG: HDIG domain-containing metalloprotein [Bacillota bacterium]